jgi:site-specific DNA recombinase
MQLLIAARLSRAGDGAGIETQDEDARTWAEANGHEVIGIAADDGVSGKVHPRSRPQLGPWLTDPRLITRYEGIVAAKADRISRSWFDVPEMRKWAEDTGKTLFVVQRNLQWPAPGDPYMNRAWNDATATANEEWELTSQRYRRKHQWLRDNGYLVGRPPFGYRVSCEHCGEVVCGCSLKCKHHMYLVPVNELMPYVVSMFEKCLAGFSLSQIAAWLDSQGIPSPQGGRWSDKSVSQILRNATYTGKRKNSGSLVVEPMITSAMQKSVIRKLESSPRKRGAAKGSAMLTGVIYCWRCSGTMYRKALPRKDRVINVYWCSSKCGTMVPLDKADELASTLLMTAIGREPMMRTVIIPGHGQEEIELIEEQIRNLDLDAPDYDAQHASLRARRRHLLTLRSVPDRIVDEPTGETIGENWRKLDSDGKRQRLRAAGIRVYADKDLFWVLSVKTNSVSVAKTGWAEA